MTKPRRPAGVPPRAKQEIGGWSVDGFPHGTSKFWSREGVIERLAKFSGGKRIAEEAYEDGALWMRKKWGAGKLVQSFFWPAAKTPTLRSETVYKKASTDVEETLFSPRGKRLYSIRAQEVAPGHVRRYDDGKRVFEAKWTTDGRPPTKVAYYDLAGRLLAAYVKGTSGTGAIHLFDRTGAIEGVLRISNDAEISKYGTWDEFLPRLSTYKRDRAQRDPDVVRASILAAIARDRDESALEKIKPHKALTRALGPQPWKRTDSAFGRHAIAQLASGVLADDESLARFALSLLWLEIAHLGRAYPATYRVATAFATVLPKLAPAAQKRMKAILRDVLRLQGIRQDKTGFAALRERLPKSLAR